MVFSGGYYVLPHFLRYISGRPLFMYQHLKLHFLHLPRIYLLIKSSHVNDCCNKILSQFHHNLRCLNSKKHKKKYVEKTVCLYRLKVAYLFIHSSLKNFSLRHKNSTHDIHLHNWIYLDSRKKVMGIEITPLQRQPLTLKRHSI